MNYYYYHYYHYCCAIFHTPYPTPHIPPDALHDVGDALTEDADDPLQVIVGPGLTVEHLVVLEANMLAAVIDPAVQDMTMVHGALAAGSECASPVAGERGLGGCADVCDRALIFMFVLW